MKIKLPESYLPKLHSLRHWILCLFMAFAFSSCNTMRSPWLLQNSATHSLTHIDHLLTVFYHQHHRYPRNIGELQDFASRKDKPISLRPFSEIRVNPTSSESVSVPYVTRSGESGVLSINSVRCAR
jgi:hypothetical protein